MQQGLDAKTAKTVNTSSVNVIVTCTNRKRAPVPDALRIRSLGRGTLPARAIAWTKRLSRSHSVKLLASELYAGEHWSVVRRLAALGERTGRTTRVWICSAGYGMIPMDAPIQPYGATFQSGDPDAVVGSAEDAKSDAARWWSCLSKWRGPRPGSPRSLTELAQLDPASPMLIAVSPPYLQALSDDARRAREVLSDAGSLVIVSAARAPFHEIAENIVSCDARLQVLVGGTKIGLNARLAEYILADERIDSISVAQVRTRFEGIMKETQKAQAIERTPMTDAEVRAFIRDALRENPKSKHSPLLRRLRDSGRACEQSRFASLFREVLEATDGE